MELKILNDCKEVFFDVINLIKKYPEYNYTLNSHIIRTIVSVGSNIAECQDKNGNDRIRFLNIAIGSCNELLFQIKLYGFENNSLIDKINKIKATCINLKSVIH